MSTSPPGASLSQLCDVMRRLLAPDGCPWDREQTLATLRPFLIEESYEVLEAIEHGSAAQHCEELGDLLFQIVFQAALREAAGEFAIDDVVRSIVDKLVRRHPHVFAGATVSGSAEVLTRWDEIKQQEKAARGQAGPPRTLGDVPRGMPALSRAQLLSRRAAAVGFDWPDVAGCRAKVDEELGEIDGAATTGDPAALEHEVGDLLFAAVSLARKHGVDAETALRAANRRFEARFGYVEDRLRERGKTPASSDLAEMDALWDQAKRDAVG
jgi:MazG family protein